MLIIDEKTKYNLSTLSEKNQILVKKFSDDMSSSDEPSISNGENFNTEIVETIKKGIVNPVDI